jgi:hypothetical protein
MHGDVRELPMQASGGDGLLVTPIDTAQPVANTQTAERQKRVRMVFNGWKRMGARACNANPP